MLDRLHPYRRRFEPVLRRLVHLYWRFARAVTMGVRGVVVDGEGRVFLVEHSYVSGWHLPGGGVEPGETAFGALTRELREEGNIEVTGDGTLHGLFHNPKDSTRDHVAVYIIRAFRQPAPPQPNNEIIAHGFFAPDALPADATPGTRRRIAEVFGGAKVAERW